MLSDEINIYDIGRLRFNNWLNDLVMIQVDTAGQTCGACKLDQQQREIALMRAREEMEEEKRRQEQQAKLEKERERRRVQSAKRREERQAVVDEVGWKIRFRLVHKMGRQIPAIGLTKKFM